VYARFWWGNANERNLLEELGVNGNCVTGRKVRTGLGFKIKSDIPEICTDMDV
jgi:hypothetical protein